MKPYFITYIARKLFVEFRALVNPDHLMCNGPFTLAIFAAISAAILRRFQIARANYWRFRGDLYWFTRAKQSRMTI